MLFNSDSAAIEKLRHMISIQDERITHLSASVDDMKRRWANDPDIDYIKTRLREEETHRINTVSKLNQLTKEDAVLHVAISDVDRKVENIADGVSEARNDMIDEVNELQKDVRSKLETFVEDFTKIWHWQQMVTEKMFGMERMIHSMMPELPETEQEKIKKALKDAGFTQFDVEFINKNAKPCEKKQVVQTAPPTQSCNYYSTNTMPNISYTPKQEDIWHPRN